MDPVIRRRLLILVALATTIKELGEGPAGPAYAATLQAYPDLTASEFNEIIASLEHAGAIRRLGNILRWSANPVWIQICEEADKLAGL